MAVENRRHFFVYGEVSRAIQAASSSQAYEQSLKLCKNAIIRPEGGVTNRLGTSLVFSDAALRVSNKGWSRKSKIRELPSPTLTDALTVFPGLNTELDEANAYELFIVDTKPTTSGFGVDTLVTDFDVFRVADGKPAFNDEVVLHAPFLFEDFVDQTLRFLRTETSRNALQFGFSSRHYFELAGRPVTIGGFSRIVGGDLKFNYLQSVDPYKYEETISAIDFSTFTVTDTKTGSSTGGSPVTFVITVFNVVTGEEFIWDMRYRDATGIPLQFSATDYITFTAGGTLPAGHEVRVYATNGKNYRSARLVGIVEFTGANNGLVYIGQPRDEGVSYPFHFVRPNFSFATAAYGLDKIDLNNYLLVTHTNNDYPFPLHSPGTEPGLSLQAPVAAACWRDQRLILGGFGLNFTFEDQSISWATNRIAFSSLNREQPFMDLRAAITSEADPFSFNMDGVNSIYHLIDHSRLVAFTDQGVRTIYGAQDGALTSSTIAVEASNKHVADPNVVPVVAGNDIFFGVFSPSSLMRAQFRRELNGYTFFDVSFTSKDLFQRGFGFNAMVYNRSLYNTFWVFHRGQQDEPTNIVTALTLRDDDDRVATHQHDFGGVVVDAISVDSKGRDSRVYMLVERTTNSGQARYFIERMQNRDFQNAVRDVEPRFQYRFYDCFSDSIAPRYAGAFTFPVGDLSQGNPITINTAVAHGLTLVNGAFIRVERDGVRWDAEITSSSAASVTVISTDDCPFDSGETVTDGELIELRDRVTVSSAYSDFDLGMSVDGTEIYSTVDPDVPAYTAPSPLATFDIVLPRWFDYAIYGFNYVSEVQSVSYVPPVNIPNVDVQKAVISVDVELENTRSLLISGYEPEDVTPAEMDSVKDLIYDGLERDYYTGRFNVPLRGERNRHARILFRQIKPEPFTILGYEASIDI